MDMITQIEMQDAIALKSKVDDRVKEVALRVAEIMFEFEGLKPARWQVDWYIIDMKDHSGDMVHLNDRTCTVRLSCKYYDRPPSPRFGMPNDDDDYEDELSSERLTRQVAFPRSYLYTDGWEDEVRQKSIANRLWWAQHNEEGIIKTIKDEEDRLRELKEKRKDLTEKVVRLRRGELC